MTFLLPTRHTTEVGRGLPARLCACQQGGLNVARVVKVGGETCLEGIAAATLKHAAFIAQ